MNWLLDNETIATTETTENGKVVLRLYDKKQIVFEKEYNTMGNAKRAMTMLLNYKYSYLFK